MNGYKATLSRLYKASGRWSTSDDYPHQRQGILFQCRDDLFGRQWVVRAGVLGPPLRLSCVGWRDYVKADYWSLIKISPLGQRRGNFTRLLRSWIITSSCLPVRRNFWLLTFSVLAVDKLNIELRMKVELFHTNRKLISGCKELVAWILVLTLY